MPKNEVTILGAGLVGSLLATLLRQEGRNVDVYEMRTDPRKHVLNAGRSINLALSHRGIRALKLAGIYDHIQDELIPMKGRMMHDRDGKLSSQPYGKEGQFINSVSRAGLNKLLIGHAESQGVNFHFDHKCTQVDLDKSVLSFNNGKQANSEVMIGTDGAYSMIRQAMEHKDRFNYEQYYIDHGYKELRMAANAGDFAMEPNYLHIWPRGSFMFIALPNPDHTFTCTLFFPFEGPLSFASLHSSEKIQAFFEQYFPDLIPLIPDFAEQFQQNPTSSLVTIKSYPWHYKNSIILGDASHAIVPFYGQGMNAGFEDCRLFLEMAKSLHFKWDDLLPQYSSTRKKDADAIADLALKNFVEMRDHVADTRFLNIKKLEARLHDHYPKEWLPLYSMVTFSDMPYSEALLIGKVQEQVMSRLPEGFDPQTTNLTPIIEAFRNLMQDAR